VAIISRVGRRKQLAINLCRFLVVISVMSAGGVVGAWLGDLLIGVPAAAPRSLAASAREGSPLVVIIPVVGIVAGFLAGVELWNKLARYLQFSDGEIK
jgi:hypothetical protein